MKHYNIIVSGLVQNVFFRDSTKEFADTIGITGFVENKNDGTVYIEIEGGETELQKMIDWCHKGPTQARVEKVSTSVGPLAYYTSFSVK